MTNEDLMMIKNVRIFFVNYTPPVLSMSSKQRNNILIVYRIIYDEKVNAGCISQCRNAVKKTYKYLNDNPEWPNE